MNKAPARVSLDEARLYLDCMEEQKERLRAILSLLNASAEVQEASPDVKTLLAFAQHIAEDHEHWYRLQDCLGLRAQTLRGIGR